MPCQCQKWTLAGSSLNLSFIIVIIIIIRERDQIPMSPSSGKEKVWLQHSNADALSQVKADAGTAALLCDVSMPQVPSTCFY